MCRKTIYYNTYGDGSEDVTERVDTCRPGKMCSHPERREYRRQFRFTKLGTSSPETPVSLADRRPTPYATDFLELPPTPRSKSPSPSRKQESGVYVNGEKIANIHNPRKEKRRSHVVVHAPEPPSPVRPVLKRHSTLPADYVVIENEARGRHSRHPTRRNSSREVPVGPVRILDDLSSRHSSPSRRSASPRPVHYREHARTPRGYDYVDDRRKSRRSSAYYPRGEDVYMTPAASPPARKEVHFTDADPVRDGIRQQNERIRRRPKLHQEVKGILKKDAAVPENEYDALRRAVGQMDIHPSSQPQMRREASDPQYWDRLRDRFEEPRERRRKSRVYYPGEGVYKYM
ncbi:hypothetical protein CONLIGDRAFT_163300 [Coniochaeta ligniaria NRRL 30616]|uniref:Uncharacterized protein n=1 Tax=Coniochaeta ligniaria NRRL 30616 TaxID=1408157 RepID=A0A1J7JT15_9PEZI|nr:hypothetical protein CONLIGDRAFT_163300 [Coniochaeta ligniaria NRRL 30616]